MNGKKGFTMIEVLLVAVIIAVLVSIAVPNYIQATERARAREAISTLNAIIAAERTYNAERRIYLDLTVGSDDKWEAIGMGNPNSNAQRSFDYTFKSSSATATATRLGPVNKDEIITMTEDGTVGGNFIP